MRSIDRRRRGTARAFAGRRAVARFELTITDQSFTADCMRTGARIQAAFTRAAAGEAPAGAAVSAPCDAADEDGDTATLVAACCTRSGDTTGPAS